MHKQNEQIRTAISTARVRYWQVAEAAGNEAIQSVNTDFDGSC